MRLEAFFPNALTLFDLGISDNTASEVTAAMLQAFATYTKNMLHVFSASDQDDAAETLKLSVINFNLFGPH